jgi:hypothetical protein
MGFNLAFKGLTCRMWSTSDIHKRDKMNMKLDEQKKMLGVGLCLGRIMKWGVGL